MSKPFLHIIINAIKAISANAKWDRIIISALSEPGQFRLTASRLLWGSVGWHITWVQVVDSHYLTHRHDQFQKDSLARLGGSCFKARNVISQSLWYERLASTSVSTQPTLWIQMRMKASPLRLSTIGMIKTSFVYSCPRYLWIYRVEFLRSQEQRVICIFSWINIAHDSWSLSKLCSRFLIGSVGSLSRRSYGLCDINRKDHNNRYGGHLRLSAHRANFDLSQTGEPLARVWYWTSPFVESSRRIQISIRQNSGHSDVSRQCQIPHSCLGPGETLWI